MTQSVEEKTKKDFRVFLYLIWKELALPDPTPLQYDMASYLQFGPKRSVIEAFRGVGKSWITSAYVVWLLYRDPQLKVMVVSASKERADQFSSFTKRLINTIDWLEHLSSEPGQRDSLISFDVGPSRPDHSPSVKSVGITGQLTGSRADVIIGDDIEVVNNSQTQTAREKLSESVKEFDAILKPLDSSRIIFLGTPQNEMSLYNDMGKRGFHTRIWPALFPTDAQVMAYAGKLSPYILEHPDYDAGRTTDPKRFSDEDLGERMLSYGKSGFALQFMLDTSLSDADKFPLKFSDLVFMSIPFQKGPTEVVHTIGHEHEINDLPNLGLAGDRFYEPFYVAKELEEYQTRVMSIDPSGRGKDETSYSVGYMLNGNIFVPESSGLKGGYGPEVLESLAKIAKKHKIDQIVVEDNFGDGMFTALLKPVLERIYSVSVEEVKHHQQKEKRMIDTLEPVMMQHRLIFDPKVVALDHEDTKADPVYSLFYQMSRLTSERGALSHDDRLDSLSILVKWFTELLEQDQEGAEVKRKEELLDQELEKFIEECSPDDLSDEASGWFAGMM
jgi:hypothetical protein